MHALKISGCMLRSAVTNGLICCTCAAWKLYRVISYVLKYISIRVPKSVIPTSSFPICLQNNKGDWPPYIYYRITLFCFPKLIFYYLRPSCNLLWNWWINFYLLPVSLVYKSFHAQLVFIVQVQVQYKGLWPVWGLLINSPQVQDNNLIIQELAPWLSVIMPSVTSTRHRCIYSQQ